MKTPSYAGTINRLSTTLLYALPKIGGTPLAAMGLGFCIGAVRAKPITYALQCLLTNLFWQYIQPNTFQKVFSHKGSVHESKIVGAALSYLTSVTISYVFNKYVIPKTEKTPFINVLTKENNKSFGSSDVFFTTIISPLLIGLLSLEMEYRAEHPQRFL